MEDSDGGAVGLIDYVFYESRNNLRVEIVLGATADHARSVHIDLVDIPADGLFVPDGHRRVIEYLEYQNRQLKLDKQTATELLLEIEEVTLESLPIRNAQLEELANSPPIGRPGRWNDQLVTSGSEFGFRLGDNGLSHPSGLYLAFEQDSAFTSRLAVGLSFEQRITGMFRVLNREWLATGDVEAIAANIDSILQEDYVPAIIIGRYTAPEDIPDIIRHELVRYVDSLTPEGRRRYAIALAGQRLNPAYIAEAMSYEMFTKMRAHAFTYGSAEDRSALEGLDTWVKENKAITGALDETSTRILVEKATGFFDDKFHLIESDFVERPNATVQAEAGRLLAHLIETYGLSGRLAP